MTRIEWLAIAVLVVQAVTSIVLQIRIRRSIDFLRVTVLTVCLEHTRTPPPASGATHEQHHGSTG